VTKAVIVDNDEGGGISLWNVPKQSGFKYHSHKGYEYIYVVDGCMDFSGNRLLQGDFLLTSAGESHEAIALETSTIMVINERSNS
jgi:quercetin dioxygenase-like cupin family protein